MGCFTHRYRWHTRFAFLAIGLGLLGCRQEEIRVYEVPKTPSFTRSTPTAPHAPGHTEEPPPGHLHWETPEGWEEISSSGVRSATFRVPGENGTQAEVSIMPFRKMGGDDLQFVNLWRTTLEMEPVGEDRLPEMVQEINIGGQTAKLYDVMDKTDTGQPQPASRIIVAMALHGDTSWFFKLAGDADAVTTQTDTFKEFLQTISFHDADAHQDTASSAAAEPVTASPAPATTAEFSSPVWTIPDGWREVPPTTMLLAKFELAGSDGGQADVTVSVFPGDVGGLLANVNRWRGQVGQPPLTEAELPKALTSFTVDGGPADLVDVNGVSLDSGDGQRLIGAIVPRGGRTWFFKLLGNAQVAAEQKEAFLEFLNSLQLPNA